MAEQIKGLSTRNADPVKATSKSKPEEPKEATKKVEETKEAELSEEELAARAAREAYLRMWPLAAEEQR